MPRSTARQPFIGEVPPRKRRRRIELSVVLPCLNEAEKLGACIERIREVAKTHAIATEIIVADGGSEDATRQIAREHGVMVVQVAESGLGAAIREGVQASRGKFVLVADANGGYDLRDIPRFVLRLRAGYDLVQGTRYSREGYIEPGALPWWSRWVGNPALSILAQWLFRSPVDDLMCGIRAFRRDLFDRMQPRCSGREFAAEVVVKSCLMRAKIAQAPVPQYAEGRMHGELRSLPMRDGLRTLRLFALLSPQWTLQFPGYLMMLLGMLGFCISLAGGSPSIHALRPHIACGACLLTVVGYQALQLGVLARVFATQSGLLPRDENAEYSVDSARIRPSLLLGAIAVLLGVALGVLSTETHSSGNAATALESLRIAAPGVALFAVAWQTLAGTMALGVMSMARRGRSQRAVAEETQASQPIRPYGRPRPARWGAAIRKLTRLVKRDAAKRTAIRPRRRDPATERATSKTNQILSLRVEREGFGGGRSPRSRTQGPVRRDANSTAPHDRG